MTNIPDNYISAWYIINNQTGMTVDDSKFLSSIKADIFLIDKTEKFQSITIFQSKEEYDAFNPSVLIRRDVVDWLDKHTDFWVLDLCKNEIRLSSEAAWDFWEWINEQETIIAN